MSDRPSADDAELARVRERSNAGPFTDDWASLEFYEVPRWYLDAKFGIFIHWGPYSVPAFDTEWYARNMYIEGTPAYDHHRATYGPQSTFGYKDFIPLFTGEHFDADDWAQLFKQAGARFVVPVAEHHDGFAMHETARSRWKATEMGPRRDVIGELAEAVRKLWLVFGVSSHRAEHWWFMGGGNRFDSDVRDPAYADFYGPAQGQEAQPNDQFLEDWLLRTVELVDRYRPQIVWFDWWIEQPAFESYRRRFAAYYYNEAARLERGVVLNYKCEAFPPGTAVFDVERGRVADGSADVWQNDTSVGRTAWCWIDGHQYKSLPELIAELVDVVAANGVLLLNIGPKPDGTIAGPERELLEGIGRWLDVNGEAIYGTRPWRVTGEGPTQRSAGSFTDATPAVFGATDIRFTSRQGHSRQFVYGVALGWPADDVVQIRSWSSGAGLLAGQIDRVEVLGSADAVAYEQTAEALVVRLPARRPSEYGVAIKVTLHAPQAVVRTDDFV
jgi:alpha-L-fucosidase